MTIKFTTEEAAGVSVCSDPNLGVARLQGIIISPAS